MNIIIGGGPEGAVYVPTGSPLFDTPTVLVSEYGSDRISAYEVDANGDPVVGTRVDFITGLSNPEGAVIDPVTGDFLFSTFGAGNDIIRVTGFIPEPSSVALIGIFGLILLASGARKRKTHSLQLRRKACSHW